MIKFGMIPEFIGRVPVVATLHDLDRASLVAILKEPKNSLIKQYQTLLEFENVGAPLHRRRPGADRRGGDDADVGARGLKIILEELMLDVMYRVPSEEEIEECVITKDVVLRRAAPILSLRKVGLTAFSPPRSGPDPPPGATTPIRGRSRMTSSRDPRRRRRDADACLSSRSGTWSSSRG